MIISNGNHIKGKRFGYWEYFWDNGELRMKGTYDLNGNKIGLWYRYCKNGELFSKDYYS